MADLVVVPGEVIKVVAGGNDKVAGASINAGQMVYDDTTDGNKMKLAGANVAGIAAATIGIALNDAEVDQHVKVATSGEIALGVAPVAGTVYVLSATAGGIAPDADIIASGAVKIVLGTSDGTNFFLGITPNDQRFALP